jgi:hypothetical protein
MKPELETLEHRVTPTAVCEANPVYQAECAYLGNLIPTSAVTLTAVQSGNWSSAATWGGRTPTANDVVYIPYGDTVTVNNTGATALAVLNNGVLTFATNANTRLTVDTVVSGTDTNSPGNPQGEFDMGTAANPIQAGFTATLEFQRAPAAVRNALFEGGNDYDSLSGGLISMGTLNIYGSQVTPYDAVSGALAAGTTTFQLAQVPVGWKAGDTLLFAGTVVSQGGNSAANQDEQIQIAAISGNTVTLASALQYAHAPAPSTQFLVADETRSVVIESAPGTPAGQQGCVMQMHNDAAGVAYADFLNLGRTDKSQLLNNGSPTTGPGLNQVGRYALHFHRCDYPGLTNNDPPILVQGCYQANSPGWGYVNHSSDVDFVDNVAYNDFGACFTAEAGNEIGAFNGNYAVRATGVEGTTQNDILARETNHNFGFNGEGYWLQSPGCVMTNNVATDCQIGYAYWSKGLDQPGLGVTQFYTPWAPDPTDYGKFPFFRCDGIPLAYNSGNTASYGDTGAWILWNSHGRFNLNSHPTLDHFTASDVNSGIEDGYFVQDLVVQNSTLIAKPGATGIGVNAVSLYVAGYSLLNDTVVGFPTGAILCTQHANTISGGYYDNVVNFAIPAVNGTQDGWRSITFSNLTFGPHSQTNYQLSPLNLGFDYFNKRTAATVWANDTILLPNGQQLYYANQMPNSVPFPAGSSPSYVPPQLIGLTAQQIYNQFGLAPDGGLAPANATPLPGSNGLAGSPLTAQVTGSNGLAGSPPTAQEFFFLRTPTYAPASSPYTLQYRGVTATGAVVYGTYPTPFTLQMGWNAITVTLNGQITTFFVCGT